MAHYRIMLVGSEGSRTLHRDHQDLRACLDEALRIEEMFRDRATCKPHAIELLDDAGALVIAIRILQLD